MPALAKRTPATIEEPPPSLEEQLASTRATIKRLDALKAELAEEEGALYRRGALQNDGERQHVTKSAAQALLDGASDVLLRPSEGARMLAIGERLAAVRLAIEMATKRYRALYSSYEDEIEARFLPLWSDHLRKNATLIEALRELACERHELIESWAKKTGIRPSPPGLGSLGELIGLTDFEDPTRIHGDSAAARILEAARGA